MSMLQSICLLDGVWSILISPISLMLIMLLGTTWTELLDLLDTNVLHNYSSLNLIISGILYSNLLIQHTPPTLTLVTPPVGHLLKPFSPTCPPTLSTSSLSATTPPATSSSPTTTVLGSVPPHLNPPSPPAGPPPPPSYNPVTSTLTSKLPGSTNSPHNNNTSLVSKV